MNLSQVMFSFRRCLGTIDYEKVTEFNICVYDSVTMFRFNPLKIKGKFASHFRSTCASTTVERAFVLSSETIKFHCNENVIFA